MSFRSYKKVTVLVALSWLVMLGNSFAAIITYDEA